MTVEMGSKAPNFSAFQCNGEKFEPFQLSDNLGQENLVLAFFPFAFSSACANEFCKFRDDLAQFEQLKAKIYGVSCDSPFALNAFIKANQLNFKLISDFNKEISKSFGVLKEDVIGLKGVAKRSVFVLDKQGTIRYRWVTEDAKVMPDFAELHKTLKSL